TITVQEIGAGRRILVSSTTSFLNFVGWTPDGRDVVYTMSVRTQNGQGPMELWRAPAAGGSPRNLHLTAFVQPVARPALSPDGQRLAYIEVSSLREFVVHEGFLRGLTALLRGPQK